MRNWIYSAVLRFVIAVAVGVGMALLPVGNPASVAVMDMMEAETACHAERQLELSDHGHAHDAEMDDEQKVGHLHGHDPADHSHETPHTLTPLKSGAPAIGRDWFAHASAITDPGMVFRLDRPPRTAFVT